ncbi:MAG: hypothetical protein MJE66_17055 [Proteobacteria bacterium]|nr:hypothetical protein [Pseudomonadota bacterium]
MVMAQGRFWRVSLAKSDDAIVVSVLRDELPEDLREIRELRVSVPLDRWNRVFKHVLSDRKLLGGILLDFANHKEQVSLAVGRDRLFAELQRVVLDATVALVETGALALTVVDVGAD